MIRIFATFECSGKVVAHPFINRYWNIIERYFRLSPYKWEYLASVKAQEYLLIKPCDLIGKDMDFVIPRREEIAYETDFILHGAELSVKGYIGIDEWHIKDAKPWHLLYLASEATLINNACHE